MNRKTTRRVVLSIVLSNALGLAVAQPVRGDLSVYNEYVNFTKVDSPQSARDFNPPPLFIPVDPGSYPFENPVLRCASYAGLNDDPRRGVPMTMDLVVLDAETGDVIDDPEGTRVKTKRDGWALYDVLVDPLAFPGGIIVIDLGSEGGRDLDEVHHQCLLGVQTECAGNGTTACVPAGGPGRFQVNIDWKDPFNGQPRQANVLGVGRIPATDSEPAGGFARFGFRPLSDQLLLEILDGCAVNGFNSFWVFAAATTNVEYTLRITDTETGATKNYFNDAGRMAPAVTDTSAFSTCP